LALPRLPIFECAREPQSPSMDALAKLDEEEMPGEPWDVRIDRDWRAIEYAPIEGYRDNKDFMMNLCKVSGYALEFVDEELLSDKELVLQAVRHSYGDALKWAPKDFHRDRDFMLDCVSVSAEVLKLVSNKCKNDEGAKTKSVKGVFFCYRRGGKDGLPFPTGPCNPTNKVQCESCARVLEDPNNCPLPQDREFITNALARNWQALKFADQELRGEKDIVLAAVRSGGLAIKYASEELQADRDVAIEAVKQTWQVYQKLNKKLRSDSEIAKCATQQDWHSLKYITKDLKTNHDLMRIAVQQSWQSFEFLVLEMRRKRDLALLAVQQSWKAFLHVPPELRNDRELALLAVRQHGQALGLASEQLRADREVVLEAIRQDWRALQHAMPPVKDDKEIVAEAVQRNGFALRHSSEDLRSHPELVASAMKQQWPSVGVAVMPLFPAEDGLDPAFWNGLTDRSGIKGKLRPAVPIGICN